MPDEASLPDDIDPEIRSLVVALNRLPDIMTTGSCSGHNMEPARIWFECANTRSRSWLLLARLMSHNYFTHAINWRITLSLTDTAPIVSYCLEAKREYRKETMQRLSDAFAADVDAHVDDTTAYYNVFTRGLPEFPETPESNTAQMMRRMREARNQAYRMRTAINLDEMEWLREKASEHADMNAKLRAALNAAGIDPPC